MSGKLKLGYWDMRGFAEPIRLLLRYLDIPFEDIRYDFGDEEGDKSNFPNQDSWRRVRETIGLDFPNLPYLIDGDVRLTQSEAILNYIARKYGLRRPEVDEKQLAILDMLQQQIIDVRNRFFRTVHRCTNLSASILGELQCDFASLLGQLECWLAQPDRTFLAGEEICAVDFIAYECLAWYRKCIRADCLEPFRKLDAYFRRFEQLPRLREYLESDQYRSASCLSPYAAVGYRFKR